MIINALPKEIAINLLQMLKSLEETLELSTELFIIFFSKLILTHSKPQFVDLRISMTFD